MPFTETFLQSLVARRVTGGFPPFSLGEASKIERYVQKLVARLCQNTHLLLEADFDSFGSGYASFITVRVTKKDLSATTTTVKQGRTTHDTAGLLLYVSRLAPYWFYGSNCWSSTFENGELTGGGSRFLEPNDHLAIDPTRWQATQQWLVAAFNEFRYGLLTAPELSQPAPTAITHIPTELANPPYRVFDCFFYWMD